MTLFELLSLPTARGNNGIHICAQLRIEAQQLRDNRIPWAAATMEQAANHIEALEKAVLKTTPPPATELPEDPKPDTTT